jgi:dienelactone hydrolase
MTGPMCVRRDCLMAWFVALCCAAGAVRAQAPTDDPAAAAAAAAASASMPPVARDLHEDTQRIAVTVKDLYGREETKQIPVTIFRPDGPGPFPLVIMNHGRAPADKRASQGRQRFEPLSRYFVAKGFAVLLPTRVGYADTFGDFDPEATGSCASARLEPQAKAASDQVLATLDFAKTLPFIDTARWIVAGQSVGGLTTVATVARHPPGLVGAINFAGGTGGDPERSPGRPCNPQRLASDWESRAAEARAPMLWLYWENDEYWGADNPQRWRDAWIKGGGKAEFLQLAAAGKTGHGAFNFDMDHWVPFVERFLAELGFAQPGVIARPAATAFAKVDEADKVPVAESLRQSVYRRFLERKPPRAFAIGPNGATGWASGDWALGRALGNCQRRGAPCKLYAVDDDVVWTP